MSYPRILLLLLGLSLTHSLVLADTITSTPGGGPWFAGGTWVGGVVPEADDDVVIVGPVTISGVALCRNAELSASGSINGAIVAPPRTLRATGAITNLGAIGHVNPYYLEVEVGGDLHNAGTWTPVRTRLIGSAHHYFSQAPGQTFSTDLGYGSGASGDLIATTPIAFSGAIDLSGGRLILPPECPCTLDGASFRGNMLAGGNELRFLSWSYLLSCSIDDVVFVGGAEASFGVTVTTQLTVMESLQNGGNSGGGSITVEGDLINHGVIRNDQYSFPVRVRGDIENHGEISCPQLELLGAGVVHHLSMGPYGIINAPVFLPEFQAATLIAETPVRLGGGLGLGVGTLVLQEGASLEFVGYGGVGSGTVLAGGNAISVQGAGAISGVTIDSGVFGDRVVIHGDNLFTGGLTVNGTVESWPWAAADLEIDGTLENHGAISDGAHPVRIRARGDLVNHGAFTNARVVMAGTVDQSVGAGPLGLAVPEFVIESHLTTGGYQWYRDGLALAGETGADLTLSMVDAEDYGTYHCEANGETSRHVVIAETAGVSSVVAPGAAVVLAQNQPNPFHPATHLVFSLDGPTRVLLEVYSAAGRRVASLIDREMNAGRHEIAWQAEDLPSGTYLIRLRAGGLDLSRKCTLLR